MRLESCFPPRAEGWGVVENGRGRGRGVVEGGVLVVVVMVERMRWAGYEERERRSCRRGRGWGSWWVMGVGSLGGIAGS